MTPVSEVQVSVITGGSSFLWPFSGVICGRSREPSFLQLYRNNLWPTRGKPELLTRSPSIRRDNAQVSVIILHEKGRREPNN